MTAMYEVLTNDAPLDTGDYAYVAPPHPMTSCRRKPLVAIVDDEPSVCRALRRLVWTREINAETFTSGPDFLEALRTVPSFQPECVILDMHMPDMDGFEVLRQLVRSAPHIPVVVLTAGVDAQIRRQALASGAASFFEKPLVEDVQLFLDTVLALIRQRSPRA
jgi:FixJ family two-component response regulator